MSGSAVRAQSGTPKGLPGRLHTQAASLQASEPGGSPSQVTPPPGRPRMRTTAPPPPLPAPNAPAAARGPWNPPRPARSELCRPSVRAP